VGLIKARERARKVAERRLNWFPNSDSSRLICGDALTELRKQPEKSTALIITSPPYYGLRDYQMEGQIGLEETPEEYVAGLVEVFRDARRILKDDGTLWIVIGDSYAGSGKDPTGWNGIGDQTARQGFDKAKHQKHLLLRPKELIGVPWMLAFALRADGWLLRQEIIWSKPNPMPESVTDRFTSAHEHIFLLTKQSHYYFDQEAAAEPAITAGNIDLRDRAAYRGGTTDPRLKHHGFHGFASDMRNRRSVWTIPTNPAKDVAGHFATYPEEVARIPILCATRRGDVVLDPFVGSGTTAVMAKRLGRVYIGIDLNPDYIQMAEKRLADTLPHEPE
jgi:DNA modification methylase